MNQYKTTASFLETVQRLRMALNQFSVGESEYQITQVSSHKLLGVHVDNHLKWDTHMAHLCCNIRSSLQVLNKIKFLLPHEARLIYYNGLI